MQFIIVGQIVSTFGLKGHVKVMPLTDFLERFAVGSRLRLQGEWVTVESVAEHKSQLNVKLSGIDSIEQAEGLRGAYLESSAANRPKLAKDEYYTSDLIGLDAFTDEGERLGTVKEVVSSPAHDLIVVGEIVIPAVKQFVKKVDLKKRKIVLALIPGMRPGEE